MGGARKELRPEGESEVGAGVGGPWRQLSLGLTGSLCYLVLGAGPHRGSTRKGRGDMAHIVCKWLPLGSSPCWQVNRAGLSLPFCRRGPGLLSPAQLEVEMRPDACLLAPQPRALPLG